MVVCGTVNLGYYSFVVSETHLYVMKDLRGPESRPEVVVPLDRIYRAAVLDDPASFVTAEVAAGSTHIHLRFGPSVSNAAPSAHTASTSGVSASDSLSLSLSLSLCLSLFVSLSLSFLHILLSFMILST